jgi:hypothetical protein
VVFFAGVGYQTAQALARPDVRVGPFDASGLSVVLGAGLGYVFGGVTGRRNRAA